MCAIFKKRIFGSSEICKNILEYEVVQYVLKVGMLRDHLKCKKYVNVLQYVRNILRACLQKLIWFVMLENMLEIMCVIRNV